MVVTPEPAWTGPVDAPVRPVVVRPRTVFALVLDDPKFGGLQIKVRSQSFGEWTDTENTVTWPGDDAPDAAKDVFFRRKVAEFAAHIVEWNLTDEHGRRLPISAQALMDLDRNIVLDLCTAWTNGQNGEVEAPLDSPSPGGRPSVEASIPMDVQ